MKESPKIERGLAYIYGSILAVIAFAAPWLAAGSMALRGMHIGVERIYAIWLPLVLGVVILGVAGGLWIYRRNL